MKVLRILRTAASVAGVLTALSVSANDKATVAAARKPLKAAIFVVNHAGQGFDDRLDTLNDLITARLTEKGFSIIDKKEVVKPMTESNEDSAQVKAVKRQLAEFNVAMQKREEDFLAGVKDDMDGASALRLAQQIGADYVLMATVTSFGKQSKKAVVLGQNVDVSEITLRVGMKLLEGLGGGSVYGDIVKVSAKVDNTIEIDNTELINGLLEDAANKIGDNVEHRMKGGGIAPTEKVADASLQINSNIENADVMVDGVVVGNAGQKLNVKPGLHAVVIRREWFRDWKRSVNIQPGMVLNVHLELSDLGMKKYQEVKTFELTSKRYETLTDAEKAAIADRTKLNAAEAYMLMKAGDAAVERAKHPAAKQININADINVGKR